MSRGRRAAAAALPGDSPSALLALLQRGSGREYRATLFASGREHGEYRLMLTAAGLRVQGPGGQVRVLQAAEYHAAFPARMRWLRLQPTGEYSDLGPLFGADVNGS